MKATGIVRRIDDLGRVVIPKEIRRTMRIREGDPLEIFTANDGEVVLKKYSPVGELSRSAEEYAASSVSALGGIVLVSDTDKIIAVAGGSKKNFFEKKISKDVEKIMQSKASFSSKVNNKIYSIISDPQETEDYTSQIIVPIITQGDLIGSIIFLSSSKDRTFSDAEQMVAEIGANFLAKQVEN